MIALTSLRANGPLLSLIVGLTLISSAARAQTVFRVDAYPIPTVTLTQTQFLKGEKNGEATTVAGILRVPGPLTVIEKKPAVILLSGLGGANSAHEDWAAELLSLGVAVFTLDSFGGRKLYTLAEHARLASLARMLDAFAAVEILKGNPRVDASRIAIMGLSGGAVAALYSSNKRFTHAFGPPDFQFAAHVVLYAPCHIRLNNDAETTGKPIRLFHGIADDWTPIGPCRSYVERLKKAGADVSLAEFPDAHHAYDLPMFKQVLQFTNATSVRNCVLEEGPDGVVLNSKTGKPFGGGDACLEKGPHLGYNAAAHQATVQSVKAFLKHTFRLP